MFGRNWFDQAGPQRVLCEILFWRKFSFLRTIRAAVCFTQVIIIHLKWYESNRRKRKVQRLSLSKIVSHYFLTFRDFNFSWRHWWLTKASQIFHHISTAFESFEPLISTVFDKSIHRKRAAIFSGTPSTKFYWRSNKIDKKVGEATHILKKNLQPLPNHPSV